MEAPVVGLSGIEIWSSDGLSIMGSPASARSVFQRVAVIDRNLGNHVGKTVPCTRGK
jgi:hypothetical protein